MKRKNLVRVSATMLAMVMAVAPWRVAEVIMLPLHR